MSRKQVDSIANYYYSREGKYVKKEYTTKVNRNFIIILGSMTAINQSITTKPEDIRLSSDFIKYISNDDLFDVTIGNDNEIIINYNKPIEDLRYYFAIDIKFKAYSVDNNDIPIKLYLYKYDDFLDYYTDNYLVSYNRTAGNNSDIIGYDVYYDSETFYFQSTTRKYKLKISSDLDLTGVTYDIVIIGKLFLIS